MAIFINLVSLVVILIIFLSPYLVIYGLTYFNLKYRFLLYVLIQIMLLAIEVFIWAWWVDYSNNYLIEYYGYNWDWMNEREIYANVLPENMSKVKSLERSLFGIGWPLKAMFGFVMFIPYIPVAYLLDMVIKKLRVKYKEKWKIKSI